ncbi:MAG: cupredoxin domain-containing protein, partial [Proteobacteria bacterium]|nr:cupredoxin domain-containing protein [Pseudomonadota bacterium]
MRSAWRWLAVLAACLMPMAAARAELPTHTLTFTADGRFDPPRLEVAPGRFKIV